MVIPLSGNNYGCVTVQSKRYPTGVQYKKFGYSHKKWVVHTCLTCRHPAELLIHHPTLIFLGGGQSSDSAEWRQLWLYDCSEQKIPNRSSI